MAEPPLAHTNPQPNFTVHHCTKTHNESAQILKTHFAVACSLRIGRVHLIVHIDADFKMKDGKLCSYLQGEKA